MSEYMQPPADEVVVRESVEVPQPEPEVVREETVVEAKPLAESDRLVQPHVVGTPTADPNPGADEANVVERRTVL